MSEIRKSDLKPLPPWVAPALVAFVGWTTGAHQPGPLSVYASDRSLPFVWYLFEQAMAVGITIGALAAGAALLGGRTPPAALSYRVACEARYPLALAAALASRTANRTIFPVDATHAAGRDLLPQVSALQWAWLSVMVLAVTVLLLQAALKYLKFLSLFVPGTLRPALALLAAIGIGETTGQMVTLRLANVLFWPP